MPKNPEVSDIDTIRVLFPSGDNNFDSHPWIYWPGEKIDLEAVRDAITEGNKSVELEIIQIRVREELQNIVNVLKMLDGSLEEGQGVYNVIAEVAAAVKKASNKRNK